MTLIWKLLRQHISIPQFMGFFFANLFGMFVVMLGFQFYHDVINVFTAEDSFMKSDYVIINKRISTSNTISGSSTSFSDADKEELASQPFISKVGAFIGNEFKVFAQMGVNGNSVLNSELFIESIPDEFVDIPAEEWQYTAGSKEVPIIIPRSYVNMYNFGFAQSRKLPKISDGLTGMIDFRMNVHGKSLQDDYVGRVVGISGRLTTIVVPQSFMEYANNRYSANEKAEPNRLLVEVKNPGDERFSSYLETKGYEMEDDRLNAEKTTYFLRLVVTIVMLVGLVISVLSFYILMLSIYLLLQKNSSKLENLLLIGYSPFQVALPYQLLTLVLNVLVFMLALIALFFVRQYYLDVIFSLYPQMEECSMLPAFGIGICLLLLVTILNLIAIRQKVIRIWKRKD